MADTLFETLNNESKFHFDKVKDLLTQNVVENIKKYGYQKVYFHSENDKELMRVERYPTGEDCPEIHISLARLAEKYFTMQGLNVYTERWLSSGAIKVLKISK